MYNYWCDFPHALALGGGGGLAGRSAYKHRKKSKSYQHQEYDTDLLELIKLFDNVKGLNSECNGVPKTISW